MNKMKKSMAVLLTGAMVCGLAACGNQDKKEEKTADGKEKLTIGYTFPSTNNEFWGINSLDCAKQAADALVRMAQEARGR
mgnify:CR=1 FL=1